LPQWNAFFAVGQLHNGNVIWSDLQCYGGNGDELVNDVVIVGPYIVTVGCTSTPIAQYGFVTIFSYNDMKLIHQYIETNDNNTINAIAFQETIFQTLYTVCIHQYNKEAKYYRYLWNNPTG
jgi:hypothetical protein